VLSFTAAAAPLPREGPFFVDAGKKLPAVGFVGFNTEIFQRGRFDSLSYPGIRQHLPYLPAGYDRSLPGPEAGV
jgi:hypothetical protein